MKTELIHFTGRDTLDPEYYAARLLAYTKNTRLNMTPEGLSAFMQKPRAEIDRELEYMAATIPSSWEFVDLVFAINGVSRACAQQITRTRNASFAMQSQRVTDMSAADFHLPKTVKDKSGYAAAIDNSFIAYANAVERGESLEDARGLLPMNIHCNLIAKYNLRAWVELVRARTSLRVQGEYQEVIAQMKSEVLVTWPWVEKFLEPKAQKAIALIEEVASALSTEQRMKLAKAADLLKKE